MHFYFTLVRTGGPEHRLEHVDTHTDNPRHSVSKLHIQTHAQAPTVAQAQPQAYPELVHKPQSQTRPQTPTDSPEWLHPRETRAVVAGASFTLATHSVCPVVCCGGVGRLCVCVCVINYMYIWGGNFVLVRSHLFLHFYHRACCTSPQLCWGGSASSRPSVRFSSLTFSYSLLV